MKLRFLAIALASTLACGTVLVAPEADASQYDCKKCQVKCDNAWPSFLKGPCREGCKVVCKVANAVVDTTKTVWERVKETVTEIAGQAITFVNTWYHRAEDLWNEIKNLQIPLIRPWKPSRPAVDLRPMMQTYGIKVKTQQYSTCMAHALSSAFEYALIPYLMKNPKLSASVAGTPDPRGLTVSRKHLYYLSRHGLQICDREKNKKMGSWALQTAGWLKSTGTFLEKYWPFTPWDPTSKKYPTCMEAATDGRPSAEALANRHFFINQFFYLPGVALPDTASVRRASDIKAILDLGFPVVVTVFTWGGDRWKSKTGDVEMPHSGGLPDNAHYILLLGYDDARQRFHFVNSWGEKWGNKGYGTLPYAYVTKYAIEGLFIRSVAVK
jgi:hypothetical protein